MNHQVKIKVRPNQSVQFPDLCVYCGQPGGEKMELRKRIGRITRLIDVPLCADCAQILHKQSGDEERLQKISWLVTGLVVLLLMAIVLLLTPTALTFTMRLLIALSVAVLAALGILRLFRRIVYNVALPDKKAIIASASIAKFSWRATTFAFTNKVFAERFKELNERFLMEI